MEPKEWYKASELIKDLDIKERRKQTIMNNIDDLVEIYECPLCGGAGILEED